DNLRSALEWYTADGQAERALQLAASLWRFWELRGHWREGSEWLARALALPGAEAPTAIRARALVTAGVLAWKPGEYPAARRCHEESLAIRRACRDQRGIAACLLNLGSTADCQGDTAAAQAFLEESLEVSRACGDVEGVALALGNLATLADGQGDYARALA